MVATASPVASFLWGEGGEMKSPEQVKREREIAAALMKNGMDYSPVGHWTQGLARAAQGLAGGLETRWANEAESKGKAGATDAYSSILASMTGGGAPASMGTPGAVAPTGADAASIRQGLIARGLPEHVADGFLMNFQDESGLNPGINEQNPTVVGSRGGYGLYQLTGPRRVAYEQYAAQKGVDPSDVNAQLDFMMSELQGLEANAAKSILAAPDAGSAAAAIATNFLRPAAQNLAPRVARYTAGGQPTQVASLDPSIGAPAGQQPAQQQIAQALMGGAQSAPAPAHGGMPSIQQLAQVAGNEWLNDSQRSIINSLLGQQMQSQQQANDPLRQLQIQAAQQGLDAPIEVGGVLLDRNTMQPIFDSRTTKGAGLINAGDGKIYNPATQEWITAPGSAEGNVPDSVKALDMRAQRAGLQPGTPEYNEFMVSGGRAGTSLSVGPDGTVNFSQGGSGRPLTEGQSKDTVYATRAEGALPIIDALGGELTDLRTSVTGQTPVLGNYTKSPEYQQAEQAGTEFLQAILRKDTGAAITPQETAEYGKVYLPRPGDSQQLLEQKRVSRQRALEAIKAGLPPQAILQSEQALINSSGTGISAPQQSHPPQVNTETEYNALPSGAVYLDPTGQIRTKR